MLAAVEWSQGIQDAWSRVTTFVPKFVGFLIILLIGWFIAKAIACRRRRNPAVRGCWCRGYPAVRCRRYPAVAGCG